MRFSTIYILLLALLTTLSLQSARAQTPTQAETMKAIDDTETLVGAIRKHVSETEELAPVEEQVNRRTGWILEQTKSMRESLESGGASASPALALYGQLAWLNQEMVYADLMCPGSCTYRYDVSNLRHRLEPLLAYLLTGKSVPVEEDFPSRLTYTLTELYTCKGFEKSKYIKPEFDRAEKDLSPFQSESSTVDAARLEQVLFQVSELAVRCAEAVEPYPGRKPLTEIQTRVIAEMADNLMSGVNQLQSYMLLRVGTADKPLAGAAR